MKKLKQLITGVSAIGAPVNSIKTSCHTVEIEKPAINDWYCYINKQLVQKQ